MDQCLEKCSGKKEDHQCSDYDRFSDLPDALIIHILSFLEMKDVMNTSFLSKRWVDVWTQVDSIVYSCRLPTGRGKKYYKRKLRQFYSFVDSTLMRCISPKIRKFHFRGLDLPFEDDTSIRQVVDKPLSKMFDKWLSFVLSKNVEYLKLKDITYTAPECLYHNSSLVQLKLSAVDILVSSPVSWKLLKSLSLTLIEIDDESIANILSGCPMLETIAFCGVLCINHLNIMSPSVKKLTILHTQYRDVTIEDFLDINAPWLEELEIGDWFFIPQCTLVDVSSLKEVKFDFAYACDPSDEDWFYDESDGNSYGLWWNDMVNEIVRPVHQVDELSLGTEVIQALAVPKVLGQSYPSFKCKHLMIRSPIWKNDLYAIACLLSNAPYLETLSVTVPHWERFYICPYATDHFKDTNLHLNLPKANLAQLKNVKIDYIAEGSRKQPEFFDFELMEFILSSASVLEKMILLTTRYFHECLDCPTYCACQNALNLSSRLSKYLDGCESLEWELKKGESAFGFSFLHK